MDLVVEFLLGLIILAGAYVWVKKKFLQPDIPQDIDISTVRGVPLVKKAPNPAEIKTQEPEAVVEPEIAPIQAAAEPAAAVEIEPVETVSAVQPSSEPASVCEPSIPEDSVLKRHYLGQREAERLNLSNPYPSDSVLRRHHESALSAIFKDNKESIKIDSKVEIEASVSSAVESTQASIPDPAIPEDSVLKRHYLQLIQSYS